MEKYTVKDYVTSHGGNKVIERILIANNGIAAVKCIRSLKKWAYETFGDEQAIQFVVMATPEDVRVNAEYIRMANQVEEVPGGRNTNNYANVNLIIETAQRTGVDAVWVGWGHASENPKLPDALSRTDIAFIGPPSIPMRDLGDKIASTLVAQSANVSCVPWSGTGVTVDYASEGIPEEKFRASTIYNLEDALNAIDKVGYPAMVKASEGGGGKGIRKVTKKEELEAAFRQVQGEVEGSPIFIMRMLTKCRHLEVQILADQFGEAIALYGRDCSVQRRHQKIIEEGHAIVAPEHVWLEMERAAIRLTKAVGYVGVGTVEYLFEEETATYYFLELNPRLQVEHPVTELITNINLVAAQVSVAMGIPLHRIPDIRRFYGEDPLGNSVIDFATAKRLPPKGHVIACRITGENPEEGFKPTSGGIHELTFRSNSHVWGYFSVGAAGGLHEFADSQFGHIFSHGDTREETRKELAIALKELSIRGEISTPVDYVCSLIETDTFKKNQITTNWLDDFIQKKVNLIMIEPLDPWVVVICGALFKSNTKNTVRTNQYINLVDRGQIPSRDMLKIDDSFDLVYLNIKYRLRVIRGGPNSYFILLKGKEKRVAAEVRPMGDSGLLILLNGKSHVCYGNESVNGMKLTIDGKTSLFTNEYDPSQLRTTTAGKLVRYLVENGSHVSLDQAYAEMEVMKMYLPLTATEPGILTHLKPEGSVLEPGAVVATLLLDDPEKVRKAEVYDGEIKEMKPPLAKGTKVHQLLRLSTASLKTVLAGYENGDLEKEVKNLFIQAYDPLLPFLEFTECLSQHSARIPLVLLPQLQAELDAYHLQIDGSKSAPFSGAKIKTIIEDFGKTLPSAKQKEFLLSVDSLLAVAKKFENGLDKQAQELIGSFLQEYLDVEKHFIGSKNREYVIDDLRKLFPTSLKTVHELELSHANIMMKNRLILLLLDEIEFSGKAILPYTYIFHDLGILDGPDHSSTHLRVKQILTRFQQPSFEQRCVAIEKELQARNIEALVTQSLALFDVVTGFFSHSNFAVRAAATETYIRRAYRAYEVKSFNISQKADYTQAEWFYIPPEDWKQATSKGDELRLTRVYTDDSLLDKEKAESVDVQEGLMLIFKSEEEAYAKVPGIVKSMEAKRPGMPKTILKVVYEKNDAEDDDQEIIDKWTQLFADNIAKLRFAQIRRVTVLVAKQGQFPRYFTFRERLGFAEHTLYRHIEPPLAYQLELRRLSNYDIQVFPSAKRQITLYYGQEKGNINADRHFCYFARAVIRGGKYHSGMKTDIDAVIGEAESVLGEACNALELASHHPSFKKSWHNHIFMKFVPEIHLDPDHVIPIVTQLARKYEKRFKDLRVREVELVGKLKGPHPNARFVITNPTGFYFNIDAYAEVRDKSSNRINFITLFGSPVLEGKEITDPYSPPTSLQKKRLVAQSHGTTYVYDWIPLLSVVIEKSWIKWKKESEERGNNGIIIPNKFVEEKELILNPNQKMVEVTRGLGENTIGMVAWRILIRTPEYPAGREIILIANDITFQIGSFGVKEDILFQQASALARELGIPRIYMSANSGARIGLAQEVREKFNIEWEDEQKPEKGFKYLWVNTKVYDELNGAGSIKAEQISDDKWKIVDVIGMEDGLGVENLKGSGMIAGETSLAYEETFTLTVVTGRSVGIGAYLVRLGQRTIQSKAPIILTGSAAINKLLGRKVYSSNMQLGGIQIMYANGVSHLTANDDFESMVHTVKWLSFIPAKKQDKLPVFEVGDPVDRPIDFEPTKLAYDPRHMLAGKTENNGEWVSGFFDKNSFVETLGGWGKTVVTGRARLGGIPLGVIAVETRTIECVAPADPAVADSREDVKQQAGQVWFPDSAYKTAQAIQDFNKGEELPLMIFANWRGFSGGLHDLYEEILKFGAYIVDALREYAQPVFIYIPPFGELRGGAWVVVDPAINPDMMEMYCDAESRGGVLEPSGITEVKYKERDVLKTMHRLDRVLIELDQKLKQDGRSAAIKSAIADREAHLLPIFNQIAIEFADLHDRPGRMQAKGVVEKVIQWKESRKFFFFRLKRRMEEEYVKRQMRKADPSLSNAQMTSTIKEWIAANLQKTEKFENVWKDDARVLEWLSEQSEQVQAKLKSLKARSIHNSVAILAKEDPTAALQGILQILNESPTGVSSEQKSLLDKCKSILSALSPKK